MYRNGSSSWALDTIEEAFAVNDVSEPISLGNVVAGEEGSEPLSVEESMDETFVWLNEDVDLGLIEPGDAGCGVRVELEEALGLGVGWMLHWENSSGTNSPCVYSSFKCQQSVAVCP